MTSYTYKEDVSMALYEKIRGHYIIDGESHEEDCCLIDSILQIEVHYTNFSFLWC